MARVVLLLEEHSMKVLLDGLLPRFFPSLSFLCIPHEGKQDLEKSIPRKLRAWREPGIRFIVVRDNDGGDCLQLKERLVNICQQAGRPDTMVRIACQELESWYFGDPVALAEAFDNEHLKKIGDKSRFRDPDGMVCPSRSLAELVPDFQKTSGARKMAELLNRQGNRSRSYNIFMNVLEKMAGGKEARETSSQVGHLKKS